MRSSSHYNVSTKKRKHNEILKPFFLGVCHLFVDLRISRGNPNPREKRGLSVLYCTINKFCGPRSMYEDQTLCYK